MCDMCEFCKNYVEDRIYGSNIPIKKCANKTELTHAYILKNRGDNFPGIVISSAGMSKGFFDIMYCPICGRKLV